MSKVKGSHMKVLLVEDDRYLGEALVQYLTQAGFVVDHKMDGDSGALAADGSVDIILMDWMLPSKDGITACQEIRAKGIDTPIIFLTARGDMDSKLEAFEAEADGYMVKPFSMRELLARIKSILRLELKEGEETRKAGDLSLNMDILEASCKGDSIELGKREALLLDAFMSHPSSAISRESLAKIAWGEEGAGREANVEAYVSFLRKKLAFLNSSCTISTVRNIGYTFTPGGSSE